MITDEADYEMTEPCSDHPSWREVGRRRFVGLKCCCDHPGLAIRARTRLIVHVGVFRPLVSAVDYSGLALRRPSVVLLGDLWRAGIRPELVRR